jgi:hypothetical protein
LGEPGTVSKFGQRDRFHSVRGALQRVVVGRFEVVIAGDQGVTFRCGRAAADIGRRRTGRAYRILRPCANLVPLARRNPRCSVSSVRAIRYALYVMDTTRRARGALAPPLLVEFTPNTDMTTDSARRSKRRAFAWLQQKGAPTPTDT